MSSSRVLAYDALKFFAMFLVIWGHCIQFLLSSHHLDEPGFCLIYSFHMPLFFIVSGLFSSHSLQSSSGDFLWSKFRQLLLPCLSWGVLMSAANGVQALMTGSWSGEPVWITFLNNFWFLKSLFICFVLAYVVRKCCSNFAMFAVVSILFSQFLPFYLVDVMYPLFVLGMFLGLHRERLERHAGVCLCVSVPLFVCCLLFWDGDNLVSSSFPALIGSGRWSELVSSLWIRSCRWVTGAFGSLVFISLFVKMGSQGKLMRVMAECGRYTLGIYIVHSLLFIVRNRLFPSFLNCDALSSLFFNLLVAPSVAFVLLVLSLGITLVLSRFSLLGFLLLGQRMPK